MPNRANSQVDGATRLDVRLLLPALIGWAAVAVGLRFPALSVLVFGVLSLLCAMILATRARSTLARRRATLTLGVVALLCVSSGLHGLVADTGAVKGLAHRGATVVVTGSLTADPRVVQPAKSPGDAHRSPLVVVRLDVSEVIARGQRQTVDTPLLVFGDERWSALRWRDTVRVVGRLRPSDSPREASGFLRPLGPPHRVANAPIILRGVESVRSDLRSETAELPADARGLLPALVIGDVSRVPSGLVDDMRATGMTHLMAVSGANVTIVLMSVLAVCGALRIPRRARIPVCLIALGLFVLICRPEPSVARAAVMGVVGLLATSVGRPRAAAPALGAAIVVLLVLDPGLAVSYGFALSVLATLGLVLFARSWGAAFTRRLPPRLSWVGEPLAIPIAAQVMCTPVVVLLQGAIPIVGIPANIFAAPLVAPATIAGVLVLVLAPLMAPVATGVGWLAAGPTELIAEIAHLAATVPGGVIPWPGSAWGALLLALATAIVLLCGAWLLAHSRRHPVVMLAGGLVVAAAGWPLPQPGWSPPTWVLVACDVGQGDGLVLRTGPNRAVLIDVGPDPAAMDRCITDLGVHTLDAVVLTHFHADHVAGLPGAMNSRPTGQVITTPIADDSGGEQEEGASGPLVEKAAHRARAPIVTAWAGEVLRWPGIEARVIWPARVIRTGSVQNNASLVLDVRVAGLRLLMLGDAEREAQWQVGRELRLMADPQPVDVLKVAHHGSSNHDPGLLAQLRAPYALISVGADNDYGHPAPSLLTSLARSNSQVARTDLDGDIAVSAHRGRPVVVTRGEQRG